MSEDLKKWFSAPAILTIITAIFYICGYERYKIIFGYYGLDLIFGEVNNLELLYSGAIFFIKYCVVYIFSAIFLYYLIKYIFKKLAIKYENINKFLVWYKKTNSLNQNMPLKIACMIVIIYVSFFSARYFIYKNAYKYAKEHQHNQRAIAYIKLTSGKIYPENDEETLETYGYSNGNFYFISRTKNEKFAMFVVNKDRLESIRIEPYIKTSIKHQVDRKNITKKIEEPDYKFNSFFPEYYKGH